MNVGDLIQSLRYYDDSKTVYCRDFDLTGVYELTSGGVYIATTASRASGIVRPEPSAIAVAVVDKVRERNPSSPVWRSSSTLRDWSAFTGTDRDAVINDAIAARNSWGRDRYRVLIGELTGEVEERPQWSVKPL